MNGRRASVMAHGLLLAVVVVWGTTFALIKAALRDCTPLLFNQVRMLLAAALLLLVNWGTLRRARGTVWAGGAAAGGLLALGYELQTAGLARTTPTKNALLTGTVVVLVPLLSAGAALLRGRPVHARAPVFLSALLAFAGIALLTTPAGTTLAGLGGAIGAGDVLSLLCAVAFAAHLLLLGRVTHGANAAVLVSIQIATAALLMTVATPLLERPHATVTPVLLGTWLLTAVVGTAAAFWVQTWAQKHMPASHTAVVLALEPAFAWVTSLLVLHEKTSARAAVGAALLLGGVMVSECLGGASPVPEQPEAGLHPVEDL